jgi:hypothetical protein
MKPIMTGDGNIDAPPVLYEDHKAKPLQKRNARCHFEPWS